jgi:hypothetical protein
MKLLDIINEQKELSELQGVSFDSRVWLPIIQDKINQIKSQVPPNDYRVEMIDGYDYPDQHRQFPLDGIRLTIKNDNKGEGSYTSGLSGYDKDNEYWAYLTLSANASSTTIYHELKHAYDDFRKKQNKDDHPSKKSNTIKGEFNTLLRSGKLRDYGPFGYLIWGLYYTSDEEVNAKIEEIYSSQVSANEIIQNTSQILKVYINDMFINQLATPDEVNNFYKMINVHYNILILQKYKNPRDFIKWAQDEIRYKGEKAMKRYIKVKYMAHYQNVNSSPNN